MVSGSAAVKSVCGISSSASGSSAFASSAFTSLNHSAIQFSPLSFSMMPGSAATESNSLLASLAV